MTFVGIQTLHGDVDFEYFPQVQSVRASFRSDKSPKASVNDLETLCGAPFGHSDGDRQENYRDQGSMTVVVWHWLPPSRRMDSTMSAFSKMFHLHSGPVRTRDPPEPVAFEGGMHGVRQLRQNATVLRHSCSTGVERSPSWGIFGS